MNENSDSQITKFNCLGCGALFVVEHKLPAGLTRPLRVTCGYCGNEYLLPRPGEIFCSRKLGSYAYIGWEDDEVISI